MSTERDELADIIWDLALRHLGVATSSSKHMADELLAAGYRNVEAVRALHRSKALPYTLPKDQTCIHCGHPWPCPTTKALEGNDGH